MKYKGLVLSCSLIVTSLLAIAAWSVLNSKDCTESPNSITAQPAMPVLVTDKATANIQTKAAVMVSTGLGPAYPTATDIAATDNSIRGSLCQEPDAENCTLRSDIDLTHAFAASPTQLDGKKVWLALGSNNFERVHQLLAKANTSQEALLRQADYQAAFNEFYQYAPGLLSNNVTCTDEICAASFSVADFTSIQQISAAMEKFTDHINAHSFSTQGRDSADNLELKLIFSNSAAFEAVVH